MAHWPTVDELVDMVSGGLYMCRRHAAGCKAMWDPLHERCLPDCENDAEFRARIKAALEPEEAS